MNDDVLSEALKEKARSKTGEKSYHYGGTEVLSQDEIDELLHAITAGEEGLDFVPSAEVRNILTFADLAKETDSVIREVIRRVTVEELAKALVREDEAVRKAFYRNMSLSNLKTLDERLKSMSGFDAKEKTAAQRKLLRLAATESKFKGWRVEGGFDSMEDFTAYLTWRRPPEQPYGIFDKEVTMCRFSGVKNGEELLADIERRNEAEGMGNVQIPGTNIKLINFSLCPACGRSFSYKDLRDYYLHPRPDPAFKNQAEQFRNDSRVFCDQCGTYFLPALVIADGTPKTETQFLCRVQTMEAIEGFYGRKGHKVLSRIPGNRVRQNKTCTGILNDVFLDEMKEKPTLVTNLLQYTPANLTLNLINGSNYRKKDLLFGEWR